MAGQKKNKVTVFLNYQWLLFLQHLTYIIFFNSFDQPHGVTFVLITSILWLEKLRLRKISSFSQDHTTSNLQSWCSNPGSPAPKQYSYTCLGRQRSDRLTSPHNGVLPPCSLQCQPVSLHRPLPIPGIPLPHVTHGMASIPPLNFHNYFLYILCKCIYQAFNEHLLCTRICAKLFMYIITSTLVLCQLTLITPIS